MIKAFKVKLYPNKKQSEQIDKTIGCCRFIYNQMLDERIKKYKMGDANKNKTEKEYKEIYPFLKEVSSRALQQSRVDLDTAYKNFFRNIKQGRKTGFPKFKSKHTSKLSYREVQICNILRVEGNRLRMLKLGGIKFRGKIEGEINNIAVTKTKAGEYFASVCVDVDNLVNTQASGDVVGIDMGLKHIAVTSDGNFYENLSTKYKDKIKKQQNVINKKKKGSKSREKAKIKLNKLWNKQSNIQKHFHYHVIKDIISENQTIVVESLGIKKMMKDRKVSSGFQDASIGTFLIRLKQKCSMLGKEIIEANQFYPSSKLCSCCGNKKDEIKLSDRIYECNACGIKIERDYNASLNLKHLSLEYNDYRDGGIIRLMNKSFDLNTSSFCGSPY